MNALSKSGFEKGRRIYGSGAKLGSDNGAAEHPLRSDGAPSYTEKYRGANAGNIQGYRDRNIRGGDPRMFRAPWRPSNRAPVFDLTSNDWNQISAGAFRQHMEDENLTVKELAIEIGCNDRTAENYVSGRNSPRDIHFLRSIAAIPPFAARVREICGMVEALDPRAMHQAMKVMQEASRFLEAMGANSPALDSSGETDAGGEEDVLTGDLFETVGSA